MTQTIKTVLEVDASRAVAGFKQGEKAAEGYQRALEGKDTRKAWDELGSTALIAGGAIAGGLGLATKAAIDWESAWTGVTKTVDGSDAQMAELEEGLRGLTKVLPATHEEIAGVAEAAGQLGVARGDVLGFTEVAIGLGESTNLSADEAATSLAKMSNIMGTAADEGVEGYERMGSALVALGNDGASTEADIMQMSLRLAGAGNQIGATEADILAMANALSSVGVEAELGGGAMSRAMLKMNSAVIGGGEELEAFADVAGMSASEFATAWRADPIAATNEFVGGLGRIGDSGGDASAALERVGLSGTQNAQVLLRAAGASDLMTESLELGASAWEENTALQEEAAKRYETDASKIQIATNSMKDAAIDAGAVFGPMLAGVAGFAADAADQFVKLPDPLQKTAAGLTGVAAASLLIGGGAIKTIGFAQDLSSNLQQIGQKSPKAAGGLRRVAKAGAALAGLAAARVAVGALQDAFDESVPSADALATALDNLHESSDLSELNEGIQNLDIKRSSAAAVGIQDMGEAVEFLSNQTATDKTRDWVQGLVGMDSDVDRLTEYVGGLDQALADMYDQDPTKARETWASMVVETRKAGGSIEDLREQYPLAAAAAKRAAEDGGQYEEHLSKVEQEAAEAEDALDKLQNQIEQLGGGLRGERAAQRDYNDAVRAAGEIATMSADEQEAALDRIADGALGVASAQVKMGRGAEVVAADMAIAREAFVQAGLQAGKSRPYMENLADSMGLIPSEVHTLVTQTGAKPARAAVLALDQQILSLDGKTVPVREAGALAAKGNVLQFDGALFGLPSGKKVNVREVGSTAAGNKVVVFKNKVYEIPLSRTVHVAANVSGLGSLAALEARVSALSGRSVQVAVGTYRAGAMERGGIIAGGVRRMEEGGMIAGGTLSPGIYPTSRQGILMAEDERAPFESYISGRADLRDRSLAVLSETARMMNHAVIPMERGGMREHYGRTYTPAAPQVTVQAPPGTAAPAIDYNRLGKAIAKHVGPAVYDGSFRGTSLQRRNEYANAASTPRGRPCG